MTEVILRTYDGKVKRICSVYLSVPPVLKEIEEELKRLGYRGEILCYQSTGERDANINEKFFFKQESDTTDVR
jgi:hypothetical protein